MRDIKTYCKKKIRLIQDIKTCVHNRFSLKLLFLCDVTIKNFPKNTVFGHPFGIVIRSNTKIGDGCIFRQHVTIGQRRQEQNGAIIGNNVYFGANAIVLGDIVIGDNVKIGAGAIILKDVPADRVIVGIWK